jgi:hypothetical protein
MKYNVSIVLAYFKSCGLPPPIIEYTFYPGRRHKSDFAWPTEKVALEVQGGVYTGQAHGSITGILKGIEKDNLYSMAGWLQLKCLPNTLLKQDTVNMIQRCLSKRTNENT